MGVAVCREVFGTSFRRRNCIDIRPCIDRGKEEKEHLVYDVRIFVLSPDLADLVN